MVVKAATKKWLMDKGLDQHTAHLWADGIRPSELIKLNFDETMQLLYRNYYNRNNWMDVRIGLEKIMDEETFFRDGPLKNKGFYPPGLTFRDVKPFFGIDKDMRYDDFIYERIKEMKNHIKKIIDYTGGLNIEKLMERYRRWGVMDKPKIAFINYNILPFNEKS